MACEVRSAWPEKTCSDKVLAYRDGGKEAEAKDADEHVEDGGALHDCRTC